MYTLYSDNSPSEGEDHKKAKTFVSTF